ncbi:MAG TPA: FHA domain-containing protein [Noviherbaspirillum sp.]|uniref:FHA domain-containing protein n=1 Tax=Noviherbaspirillum sp. TaxID=1926288 RepID=UPI002D276644|nr:FHA domain-containing protein [Noviherbaspirillum sp.]HYD95362.1 FHA domain-containing protein [Noviherbaspirillum sp.]
MAKIILSNGARVLRELALTRERVTIGRRPHNDVVIDDRAISGEHAVIVSRDGDAFLEDLNSTNGTQVNGQPVKKHYLQDNDVIELAQYRITYVAGASAAHRPEPAAAIRVLNGPSAGREILLNKVLTTLGRPELQVAVVTRKDQSYFLAHVEGDSLPKLNGREIGTEPRQLADGDLIDLGGTEMRVLLKDSRCSR